MLPMALPALPAFVSMANAVSALKLARLAGCLPATVSRCKDMAQKGVTTCLMESAHDKFGDYAEGLVKTFNDAAQQFALFLEILEVACIVCTACFVLLLLKVVGGWGVTGVATSAAVPCYLGVQAMRRRATRAPQTYPNTFLHSAAARGDLPGVKTQLGRGPGRLSPSVGDRRGRTPLIVAVIHGHPEVLDYLLRKCTEFDINAADEAGCTALHYAVALDRPEMVKKLLHHRANVARLDSSGRSPVHLALQFPNRVFASELASQQVPADIVARCTVALNDHRKAVAAWMVDSAMPNDLKLICCSHIDKSCDDLLSLVWRANDLKLLTQLFVCMTEPSSTTKFAKAVMQQPWFEDVESLHSCIQLAGNSSMQKDFTCQWLPLFVAARLSGAAASELEDDALASQLEGCYQRASQLLRHGNRIEISERQQFDQDFKSLLPRIPSAINWLQDTSWVGRSPADKMVMDSLQVHRQQSEKRACEAAELYYYFCKVCAMHGSGVQGRQETAGARLRLDAIAEEVHKQVTWERLPPLLQVVGAPGSGKTTLINTLLLLLVPGLSDIGGELLPASWQCLQAFVEIRPYRCADAPRYLLTDNGEPNGKAHLQVRRSGSSSVETSCRSKTEIYRSLFELKDRLLQLANMTPEDAKKLTIVIELVGGGGLLESAGSFALADATGHQSMDELVHQLGQCDRHVTYCEVISCEDCGACDVGALRSLEAAGLRKLQMPIIFVFVKCRSASQTQDQQTTSEFRKCFKGKIMRILRQCASNQRVQHHPFFATVDARLACEEGRQGEAFAQVFTLLRFLVSIGTSLDKFLWESKKVKIFVEGVQACLKLLAAEDAAESESALRAKGELMEKNFADFLEKYFSRLPADWQELRAYTRRYPTRAAAKIETRLQEARIELLCGKQTSRWSTKEMYRKAQLEHLVKTFVDDLQKDIENVDQIQVASSGHSCQAAASDPHQAELAASMQDVLADVQSEDAGFDSMSWGGGATVATAAVSAAALSPAGGAIATAAAAAMWAGSILCWKSTDVEKEVVLTLLEQISSESVQQELAQILQAHFADLVDRSISGWITYQIERTAKEARNQDDSENGLEAWLKQLDELDAWICGESEARSIVKQSLSYTSYTRSYTLSGGRYQSLHTVFGWWRPSDQGAPSSSTFEELEDHEVLYPDATLCRPTVDSLYSDPLLEDWHLVE